MVQRHVHQQGFGYSFWCRGRGDQNQPVWSKSPWQSVERLRAARSSRILIVEINELTGTLPATIGLWTDLREFKVTLNDKLTGRIPVSIANWTLLESIVIFNATLTGSIPDSLCDTLTEASIGCNVNCSCCTKLCLEDLL
jgi:hypothetical protein